MLWLSGCLLLSLSTVEEARLIGGEGVVPVCSLYPRSPPQSKAALAAMLPCTSPPSPCSGTALSSSHRERHAQRLASVHHLDMPDLLLSSEGNPEARPCRHCLRVRTGYSRSPQACCSNLRLALLSWCSQRPRSGPSVPVTPVCSLSNL